MQNKFAEVTPRNFNPMSVPGLSDEARKALNAAFDAMSTWRIETANSSEKNSEQVIEKMAAAARALGWPEQIVDATRAQLQSITKMQIQTMDHLMDAWEEQIKSPNPMTASPSAMLSKLKSLPSFSPAGSWPSAEAFPMSAINPMQLWIQSVEQWQKAWADAMTFWTKAGKPHDGVGPRRH
jgi:phage-related minor tail protein